MSTPKTAFVTGASSGIGHATALELARAGFFVFAGVRNASDAMRLGREGLEPVELDVTDDSSIAAAADLVHSGRGLASGERGHLDVLVNNAGIGAIAPVEHVSQDELRRVFDVDFFGQVAVIQAFLPLLRASRGRIVNIGTVGSHLALPFGSPLGAAKAAFRSMNDSLRLELRPFGIHVTIVEPGAINTPAIGKTLGDPEGTVERLGLAGSMRYGDAMRKMMRRGFELESGGSPPEVVARTVLRAVTAKRPRIAYRSGKTAGILTLMRAVPPRVYDLVMALLLSYA
jgi:NAD(P)-dependent dehydrogenase (short-subunit alcohol dehydrogenase family)